jgi:hypothetical protein
LSVQSNMENSGKHLFIWRPVGILKSSRAVSEEVTNGEWLFFWCYPRDRVQPDLRGYHNVHYTLKPDGALTLTRDE